MAIALIVGTIFGFIIGYLERQDTRNYMRYVSVSIIGSWLGNLLMQWGPELGGYYPIGSICVSGLLVALCWQLIGQEK